MKRIAFRVPKQQERAIIKVDDVDAARFKVEYWLARNHGGVIEIYKTHDRTSQSLGRELLGIKEDGVCVIHRNDDPLDFRRENLMAVSRATFRKVRGLLLGFDGGSRIQEYCKRGHELTDENRMSNGASGTICRKCSAMRNKRSYEIRKTLAKLRA